MASDEIRPGAFVAGILYLGGMIAVSVLLGMAASDVWVGVLTFAGLLALQVAMGRLVEGRYGGALLIAWLGVWGISLAATMAEYEGRWLWAVPWGLGAVLLLSFGVVTMGKTKWTSTGFFALAALSAMWAVLGPTALHGLDRGEQGDFFRRWWWVALVLLVVLAGTTAALQTRGPTRPWRWRPRSRGKAPQIRTFEQYVEALTGESGETEARRAAEEARRKARQAAVRREEEARREEAAVRAKAEQVRSEQRPEEAERQEAIRRALRAMETGRMGSPPAEVDGTVLAESGDASRPIPKPGLDEPPDGAPPERKPPLTKPPLTKPALTKPPIDGGATEYVGPAAAGEILYTFPGPLVDWAAVAGGTHFALGEDGRIVCWRQGRITAIGGVQLDAPVGLRIGGQGRLVAADRSGRLVDVDVTDADDPVVRERTVELSIGSFALNPFGTIVAYAPVRKPDLCAVVLDSGAHQVLAEGVGRATAMAFSGDGRTLALGMAGGEVRLLDMATRQVMEPADPPPAAHGKVLSLVECPQGGWIAGYRSGRLVHRGSDGEITGSLRESHEVCCLAVGAASGRVAVGCDNGRVLVHPIEFDEVVFDAALATDRVVRVAFESDELALISAGHDGCVRRALL